MLPVGSPCDTARACSKSGRCVQGGLCRGVADHNTCSAAQNTACRINQCSEDPLEIALDAQGCKLQTAPGACIHPDPCVVHTATSPTFCTDMGTCAGGEPVQCRPGAHCELGACVLDDDSPLPASDSSLHTRGLYRWIMAGVALGVVAMAVFLIAFTASQKRMSRIRSTMR